MANLLPTQTGRVVGTKGSGLVDVKTRERFLAGAFQRQDLLRKYPRFKGPFKSLLRLGSMIGRSSTP